MNDTVHIMRRVNAILQACRDDPRMRTKVADETAKWIRSKSKTTHADFQSFLHRLEVKFDIKEVTDGTPGLEKPNGIDEPTPPTKRGLERSRKDSGATRSVVDRGIRRGRRSPS